MYLIYRNWPFWFLLSYKSIDKQSNKKINDEYDVINNVNVQYFHYLLKNARHVVIITGAEISRQSDVPVLFGKTTLWKGSKTTELCTMELFYKKPFLIWDYVNYVRELCYDKAPNKIHYAIANFQKQMMNEKRNVTLITENVDGLHHKAGSLSVVELCGNIYETICTKCNMLTINTNKPSCATINETKTLYDGRNESQLTVNDNEPKCNCGGTLRPNVWYKETMLSTVVEKATEAIIKCDLIMVIGSTSIMNVIAEDESIIYNIKKNVNERSETRFPQIIFYFKGNCINVLPKMLKSFEDYETDVNKQNT